MFFRSFFGKFGQFRWPSAKTKEQKEKSNKKGERGGGEEGRAAPSASFDKKIIGQSFELIPAEDGHEEKPKKGGGGNRTIWKKMENGNGLFINKVENWKVKSRENCTGQRNYAFLFYFHRISLSD